MPKEQVIIDKIAGAATAVGGGLPLVFSGIRVDTPPVIAVPEYTDIETEDVEEGVAIARKDVYVDGVSKNVSVSNTGNVTVDGVSVGRVSGNSQVSMDSIGRQVVISTPGTDARMLRIGFPGDPHLNFENTEIVFERDNISTKYLNFGEPQDIIPLNEHNYIVLYKGDTSLTMLVYDDSTPGSEEWLVYSTNTLCDSPIIAIGHDINSVDIGSGSHEYIGLIKKIYFACKGSDSYQYKVGVLDVSAAYTANATNDPDAFIDANFSDFDSGDVSMASVTFTADDFPGAFTLTDMAVTANKVFLAFGQPVSDGLALVGGNGGIEMTEDEDVMFSIAREDVDAESNVSYLSGTMNKSFLPWNPYKKILPGGSYSDGFLRRWEAVYGVTVEEPEEVQTVIEPNTHSSEPRHIWLPNGVRYGVPEGNPDGEQHLAIRELIESKAASVANYNAVCDGWINLPGGCGAIADNVELSGRIAPIDYTNDIAGYLVKLTGTERRIPLPVDSDEEGLVDESTTDLPEDWDNGCGTIRFYKEVADPSPGAEWTSQYKFFATPKSPDTDYEYDSGYPDGEDCYSYAIYCWNGEPYTKTSGAETVEHEGYTFSLFTIGTTDYEIVIKRYFDTEHSTPAGDRGDGTWARFALVPDLSMDSVTGFTGTSSFTGTGESATPWTWIMFGTMLPAVSNPRLTPDDEAISYDSNGEFEIGVKKTKSWIDANGVVDNAITRFIPASKSHIVSIVDEVIELRNVNTWDPTLSSDPGFDESASISYDETASFFSLEAIEDTSSTGFEADSKYRYKIAFVYDGTSVSPLSTKYADITKASYYYVQITISITQKMLDTMSKRIVGINIYRAPVGETEETDYYRLVKSVPLDYRNFPYNSGTELNTFIYNDYGTALASFISDAGYSEALTSISVSRAVQCVCNNYLFAGNIRVNNSAIKSVNTDNLLVRSLPFQPSVFNYIEDFTVLNFTPLALAAYAGRVYAFGKDSYSIINPDSMSIEGTFNTCGALSQNHVSSTDFGIFVYYSGTVYKISGNEVSNIGAPIAFDSSGQDLTTFESILDGVYVKFLRSRTAVVLFARTKVVVQGTRTSSKITAFAYGLNSGRWSTYTIETGSKWRVLGAYEANDGVFVSLSNDDGNRKYTLTKELFGGSTKRGIEILWHTDCGDPDQYKYLYQITPLNGVEDVTEDVLLDEVSGPTLPVKDKSFAIKIRQGSPLTALRLEIRRLVNK